MRRAGDTGSGEEPQVKGTHQDQSEGKDRGRFKNNGTTTIKVSTSTKIMNKVQGITFKRILLKLQREGYGTKDGGLRHKGVLVMEVRAGDLIVSILTREVE